MKVLIIGARGQLGRALCRTCPPGAEPTAIDRAGLDIADEGAVQDYVARLAPALIVNAAAFTRVDAAESRRDEAFAANADGPGHLAAAAAACGARLIHISTDSVFDGAHTRPYPPDATPNPLNIYAASKLAGERAVLAVPAARPLVIRTSWLYDAAGRNFANTILHRLASEGTVRVVTDQIGTPTWAPGLAQAIWRAAAANLTGLHHWTDAGVASWYDFAVAIVDAAREAGLIPAGATVEPIRTEDYPLPARRPAYIVLDKTATWAALGYRAAHWGEGVRQWARARREIQDRIGCS